MAKRLFLVLALVLVFVMLPLEKASAGTATFSGTLVPGGPQEPQTALITTPNCSGGYVAFAVLYAAYSFSVDAGGLYTFTEPGVESAMYLYSGGFDPANPATNCVAASNTNPLNFSYNLVPGQTYYVAVIEDTFAQDGMSYSINISGPGNIITSSGCGISIPSGSVVGEAPLGAQVYYEPGNISAGVVLNPGTYWVIGQDASETYYKVVLACQTVWVRKDTMQPSYQAPQNGTPLPTRIVS
ncbi:MAG: hypothetical protein KF726_26355 [Anaerolineae bacterium]|nr:hypothetical protein [Anaerolineae bacterium]